MSVFSPFKVHITSFNATKVSLLLFFFPLNNYSRLPQYIYWACSHHPALVPLWVSFAWKLIKISLSHNTIDFLKPKWDPYMVRIIYLKFKLLFYSEIYFPLSLWKESKSKGNFQKELEIYIKFFQCSAFECF